MNKQINERMLSQDVAYPAAWSLYVINVKILRREETEVSPVQAVDEPIEKEARCVF